MGSLFFPPVTAFRKERFGCRSQGFRQSSFHSLGPPVPLADSGDTSRRYAKSTCDLCKRKLPLSQSEL